MKRLIKTLSTLMATTLLLTACGPESLSFLPFRIVPVTQPSVSASEPITDTESVVASGKTHSYPTAIRITLPPQTVGQQVDWYQRPDGTLVMQAGAQVSPGAFVQMSNGTQSSNISWSSSDSRIANVSSSGRIVANQIGKATLEATSPLDTSVTGQMNIEVVSNLQTSTQNLGAAVSIAITVVDKWPQMNPYIKHYGDYLALPGDSFHATATVLLQDGTRSSDVTWESSDPSIARVDSTGKIDARYGGETTIVARYRYQPEIKAMVTVVVTGPTKVE